MTIIAKAAAGGYATALALIAMLMLAACQTPDGVAGGAVASPSGVAYLAQIRSAHGLAPLSPDPALDKAALRQAGYMAGKRRMAHTTGWRRDFASRMRRDGIEGAAAENIAQGRMDMAKLFDMWMNSSGHRRNMLDPRFTRFGLASVTDGKDGERYWALVLGR